MFLSPKLRDYQRLEFKLKEPQCVQFMSLKVDCYLRKFVLNLC